MSEQANQNDIQQLSPDKLMQGFSKTRFMSGIVLAVVIHILFVGVTSLQFIWRTWIAAEEPEPKVIAEAPAQAGEPAADDAAGVAVSATGVKESVDRDTGSAPERTAAQQQHDQMMEKYRDTPTVRAITDAADPDEIPTMPDDLGLSIEDTNPF